jgi:hypothetical protein
MRDKLLNIEYELNRPNHLDTNETHLMADEQTAFQTPLFIFREAQDACIQQNLQIDFLYDHSYILSTPSIMQQYTF